MRSRDTTESLHYHPRRDTRIFSPKNVRVVVSQLGDLDATPTSDTHGCVGVGATRLRDPRRRFVNETLTLWIAARRITRSDLLNSSRYQTSALPTTNYHQLPSSTITYATGPRRRFV